MKKKVLFTLSLLFLILALVGGKVKAVSPFIAECNAYGFDVSEDFEPIYMPNNEVQVLKNLKDWPGDKHSTIVAQVLMRSKSNPQIYAFVYKVVSSPYQLRNWGFAGIGSYGQNYVNYMVKTTVNFTENKESVQIMDYAPKNQPASYTTTIGVGADSSGFSISASVDYNHSELKVLSNTRSSDAIYQTEYWFNNGSWSQYRKNEITSYGMFTFKTNKTVYVHINHIIQYEQQVGFDKITDEGFVEFNSYY